MPITTLVDRMGASAAVREHVKSLRFRNTILVYLLLEGGSPFPDQWIYIHSPEMKTGRITNFRNWSPGINRESPDTIICLEYWCFDEDPIWAEEERDLVRLATEEAYGTSLIPAGTVKDGKVVRIPKSYPVYSSGYKRHLGPVEKYLGGQLKLCAIGRCGAFKYNNQDHSILMGLLAAENIAEDKHHDLWAINTDYEYQESSKITATGLCRD
jgi:protoporphyrinogen oxidase